MAESELDRLRKKVENFPSASLLAQLAELTRAQGLVDEAEEWARKCIRSYPRHGQAYLVLAQLQERSGKPDDAVATLTSAVEKDPRLISAYRMLAEIHARAGRRREAIAVLQSALARHEDAALRQLLGDLERAATASLKRSFTATVRKPEAPGGLKIHASPLAPPPPGSPALEPRSAAPSAPVAMPFSRVAASTGASTAPVRGQALTQLMTEAGVRSCVCVDAGGRVLTSRKLDAGADDALAALATEVNRGGQQALAAASASTITGWSATTAQAQVLGFINAAGLSVVVLADPGVRPGMIELRAKAVLGELGAA